MDPASAAVAIVGFAGSIAALAGVVVESCKTLNNLWHLLKEAPLDTQRLFKRLKRLATVILEVRRVGEELRGDTGGIESSQSWLGNVEDMLDDFKILKDKIMKLEGNLCAKPFSKKRLCGTIQRIFSHEDIVKYDQILSGHTETFTVMLAIVSQNRANAILAETRTQSKVLNKLMTTADSLDSSLRISVSNSSTRDLHRLVESQMQTLPLNGCDQQQQEALGFLKNIPVDDRSLQLHTQISAEPTSISGISPHLPSMPPLGTSAQDELSRLSNPKGGLSEEVFGDDPEYYRSAKSLRRKMPPDAKQCVLGRLSVHRFPIGVISIAVTQNSTMDNRKRDHQENWSFVFNFCLYPPSWIANRAVTLSLTASSAFGHAPSINWSLKQAYYNSNPLLAICLENADIHGLRRLFAEGEARPSDQLAPWGNSLLHMSIINYASGLVQSLDVCEFLLEQGADPNVRSANGSTPLLLCCSLMLETSNLENGLQSLASLLIRAEADLAVYNSQGFAPCSLVFNSHHGLSYLKSFVYQHIDLYTLQEMSSVDAWILAALARSFPTFQRCMERHIASYRTHQSLSSIRAEIDIPQFNAEQQIAEVRHASMQVRTGFLRSLCAKGTVAMIEPFLNGAIDLNEHEGLLPSTYIRAAASQGNTDVVLALMKAGASINMEGSYPEYGEWDPPEYRALSPVDDLFERWRSLREHRTQFTGDPLQEYWILKKLLQDPTFREPNVLFWALWTSSPKNIIKDLLDAGCGRRDNMPSASWCQKVNGSEVIEAVKFQNQVVPMLLEYGLGTECEDCFGFTALLHALDGGQRSFENAKTLIDAGADVFRRPRSGLTALMLVKKNVNTAHPRWPMASRTPGTRANKQEIDQVRFKRIMLEEDLQAYDLVIKAMGDRKMLPSLTWSQAGFGSLMTFSALLVFITWDIAWRRPVITLTTLVLSVLMLWLVPVSRVEHKADRFPGYNTRGSLISSPEQCL